MNSVLRDYREKATIHLWSALAAAAVLVLSAIFHGTAGLLWIFSFFTTAEIIQSAYYLRAYRKAKKEL